MHRKDDKHEENPILALLLGGLLALALAFLFSEVACAIFHHH